MAKKKVAKNKVWGIGFDDKRIIPNSIVVAEIGGRVKNGSYPWKKGDHLLYLGDIHGMDGHCIVADMQWRVFWGYHTENFRMATEDEI